MSRHPWSGLPQFSKSAFVAAALVTAAPVRVARSQELRLTPSLGPGDTIDLTLTGASNYFHRIDYSTNLTRWSPLDILPNTNDTKQFSDSGVASQPLRIYRAQQVAPVTGVIRLTPSSGAPGTTVVIEGQFFQQGAPGENVVLFAGVEGAITDVSATRMVVTVPAEARTGAVSVKSPDGNSFSEQVFTVIRTNLVDFAPPPGFNAGSFDVGSDFGPGVASGPGRYLVPIGDGLPTLIIASPKDTNQHNYFLALGGTNNSEVTLDALSTARAAVFQCPLFLTTDRVNRDRMESLIEADANVAALAQVIVQVYTTNTTDPWSTAGFLNAYQAAIDSVGVAAGVLEVSASPNPGGGSGVTANAAAVYPLEGYQTRFLEVTGGGSKYFVVGLPFNPVDWVVFFEELDVEKAFPNGRPDFNLISQQDSPAPELYPVKPGFHEERHVSADLAASRVNFVSYLSKELVKYLSKPALDPGVQLPGNNTVFVVRGIGPAFLPPVDFDFVTQNYSDVYLRAVAMNLVAAAIDLASAAIDTGKLDGVLGDDKFKLKLIDEALKQAPTIHNGEDFLVAASKVVAFLVKEYVNEELKQAAKVLSEATAKVAQASAEALKGIFDNKKLKIASGVGQVVERATGLIRTTTLETSFIVVGDPFQLQVVSVSPSAAQPGSDLTIVFRGSPAARTFDPQNSQDQVNFEGVSIFDGRVVNATGPDSNGTQTLTVRLPADLPASADGAYQVYVNTQGRRGSGTFQLTSRPIIAGLSPREGFAAGTLAGSAFDGTQVRLKGVNFVPGDTFLFAGGTAGIEATNKSGSSGNVLLRVPAGAQTGPIRIQKNYGGQLYETSSPPFTVLGPPVLLSLTPASGPVGTTVAFKADNLGSDPSALRVQFAGLPAQQPGLLGMAASISVPGGAGSGPVSLFTPAGQAIGSFQVSTGLAGGGSVQVGGSSIITLARAAEIVSSTGAPINDDADYLKDSNGTIIQVLDPPYEEGDYVDPDRHDNATPRYPVGATFADVVQVSGTVAGDATFTAPYDSLSGGTLTGTITLAGDYLTLNVGLNIQGSVVVTGNYNTINYVTFHDCPGDALVIRGNYNRVYGSNFYTNAGDGVRIEGGSYNYIEINESRGNGGNGITLTGGAEFNTVKLVTGGTIAGQGIPGSGNGGHGVALIGDAHFNEVTGFSPGIFGNQQDGIRLDGPGVLSNRFNAIVSSDNGGNGVTVTNGATGNRFGTVNFDGVSTVDLTAHRNGGSGIALYGARNNPVAIRCNSNQNFGVLLSGVIETNGGVTKVLLSTATGNGGAAARLESGTTGIELRSSSTVRTNGHGLEMAGSNTVQNLVVLDIADSTSDGVSLSGVRSNQFILSVDRSAGNGILLSGGGSNAFRIRQVNGSQGDGLVLTDGTTNNRVYPDAFVAFFGTNRNGMVINNGSSENVIDRFTGSNQRSNGIVLHGGFTSGNRFLRTSVQQSGEDGFRIEFGANGNFIGYEPANPGFGVTDLSIADNAGAGIRITDPGTDSNVVVRAFLSSSVRTQATGVVIENGAAHTELKYSSMVKNIDGVVIRNQARDVTMRQLYIASNIRSGIVISNATEVLVGSPDPAAYNQIANNPTGVEILGPQSATNRLINNFILDNTNAAVLLQDGARHNEIGPLNTIRGNSNGVVILAAHTNSVTKNVITAQIGDGVQIGGGATGNLVRGNSITQNDRGVIVTGPTTPENSILHNAITANNSKGIELASGGNVGIAAPQQMEFILDTLYGVATAPDGSRIEVFKDPGDQGAQFLAVGSVAGNRFQIPLQLDFTEIGFLYNVNATVTDPDGNTSEFGTTGFSGVPTAKVVFTSTRDGNPEIYLRENASALGSASGGTRLTFNAAADHSPSLSCDRLSVLFVSDRSGNDDIYTMPATANAPATQLTADPARDYAPHWSANCQKVLFISERDGAPGIYLMDADGSNQTRLSPPGVTDVSARFSPTGNQIAFASNRGGNFDLYVMNADGTGAQVVGGSPGADTEPAWSPDGQSLAFVSDRDGNLEIYTIRIDGTQLKRITNDSASDANPVWSLDGREILFSSNRGGGGYELYRVSRSGGAPQRFTVSGGDNSEPDAR